MVALAEVAGWQNAEDHDPGEGDEPEVGSGERGDKAAEELERDEAGERGEGGDGHFEGDGEGDVREFRQGYDEGREPECERWVGLEDGGRIGVWAHAGRGEEEPELVVAGGWEQGEEDGHGGGAEGKDLEGCRFGVHRREFTGWGQGTAVTNGAHPASE